MSAGHAIQSVTGGRHSTNFLFDGNYLIKMVEKYYIDASIWIDFYEDRKGFNNEPIGDYAHKLLSLIKARNDKIVVTDLLIRELESNYSIEEINGMFKSFEHLLDKIVTTTEQREEAKQVALKRDIPKGDALHAIIARDNKFILITRDNHFKQLQDISEFHKPEDLI